MVRNTNMVLAVDIDGILTNETVGHDYANRTPNVDNIKIVRQLYEKHTIILYTARDIVDRHVTVEWLKSFNVLYHDVIFNKPKYEYLIDDRAFNNFTDLLNII